MKNKLMTLMGAAILANISLNASALTTTVIPLNLEEQNYIWSDKPLKVEFQIEKINGNFNDPIWNTSKVLTAESGNKADRKNALYLLNTSGEALLSGKLRINYTFTQGDKTVKSDSIVVNVLNNHLEFSHLYFKGPNFNCTLVTDDTTVGADCW